VTEASGVISVVGGKITGFRAIAADATDAACRVLRQRRKAQTAERPLPGTPRTPLADDALSAIYGGRALDVRALETEDRSLGNRLTPEYPDIGAQVVFAVRHESCHRLDDVMLRRSGLGFRADRGWAAAAPASLLMRTELGWSEPQRLEEVRRYQLFVDDTATGPAARIAALSPGGRWVS
jgi:glycerol-3-phosphate dehydrogenase